MELFGDLETLSSLCTSQTLLSPKSAGKLVRSEPTRQSPGFFWGGGWPIRPILKYRFSLPGRGRLCDVFGTIQGCSGPVGLSYPVRISAYSENGSEVRIKHHRLHGPQVLDLSGQPGGSAHAVVCHGRGSRLLVPAGWISLTLVLTGLLEINNSDAPWQLAAHHIQLWLEGDLRHTSRSYAWWICIAAPAAFWDSLPSAPTIACHLIPREIRCDRELGRAVLHMARPRFFNNSRDTTAVVDGMTVVRDILLERQQSLQDQLSRCSGRTALRRHQTMLRLLRVQHLIRCNMDARLDLHRLAEIANYSPPHLIRVYREVFDETPFEYATRIRLRRAWDLVCNTNLSICDISDSLGFETESAFCRSFKQTFCCTASQARRHNSALSKVTDNQQQPRLNLRAG